MSRIVNLNEVRQREGKRLVNKNHLTFVARQGCSVCGKRPVEVHHLLHLPSGTTKRGMGRKAGDDYVVPLCPDCHRKAHSAPASFEMKHGLLGEARHWWSLFKGEG